jgi:hypothetical protein
MGYMVQWVLLTIFGLFDTASHFSSRYSIGLEFA